jgi:hypothetical protein
MESLRSLRVWAVVATAIGIGAAGCGSSRPTGNARLSGNVEVCQPPLGRCSPLATTVTVLGVHGTTPGAAVAKQYARDGRFSFVLAPGRYVPSVPGVPQVHGSGCVSSGAVVRAHEAAVANVHCSIPRATAQPRVR